MGSRIASILDFNFGEAYNFCAQDILSGKILIHDASAICSLISRCVTDKRSI